MYNDFILPSVEVIFNDTLNVPVYYIDSIPTIIYSVKGDYAKGAIVSEKDLSLTPCFIMKKGELYAHGTTLHEAHSIVHDKFNKKFSIKDRIATFKSKFPDFSIKLKAKELFDWHYYLTGSCQLGKLALLKDKDINLESDFVSINEFIELSRNKFGWDIIQLLLPQENATANNLDI